MDGTWSVGGEAFGAHVEIVPSPAGITPDLIPAMHARAAEVAAELGAFQTDQFRNTDMIAGYRRLGEELLAQVPGRIDALCLYIGTAGCFLGVSRALRAAHPALRRIAVEPAESAVLSGGPAGTHRIEGGGVGFRPDLLDVGDIDEVIAVATAEAVAMARRAAREEGVFSGPSTGANLLAALDVARRLGPRQRVATIQVDSDSSTSPVTSSVQREPSTLAVAHSIVSRAQLLLRRSITLATAR